MKKVLLFILLFQNLYAFSLLGGISPKMFNKRINELQNSQQEIKQGMNDIKAGINDVQIKLGKIETRINANANVMAQIKAGYDRSKNISAGRDVIQKTSVVNDPELLKYIIGGLLMIITYLLKESFATKKWLKNMLASKQAYKEKYEKLLKEVQNGKKS